MSRSRSSAATARSTARTHRGVVCAILRRRLTARRAPAHKSALEVRCLQRVEVVPARRAHPRIHVGGGARDPHVARLTRPTAGWRRSARRLPNRLARRAARGNRPASTTAPHRRLRPLGGATACVKAFKRCNSAASSTAAPTQIGSRPQHSPDPGRPRPQPNPTRPKPNQLGVALDAAYAHLRSRAAVTTRGGG